MKNHKLKQSPEPIDPATAAAITRLRNGKPVGEKTMPTIEQLASIAAALVSNGEPHAKAIDSAFELWTAAEAKLFKETEFRNAEIARAKSSADAADAAIPNPKSYPVSREDFICLFFPKLRGKSAEVASIARAYLRGTILNEAGGHISKEQVAQHYATWKPDPEQNYIFHARNFKRWMETGRKKAISEKRSLAGKKGAKKSLAEKKRKKSLAEK